MKDIETELPLLKREINTSELYNQLQYKKKALQKRKNEQVKRKLQNYQNKLKPFIPQTTNFTIQHPSSTQVNKLKQTLAELDRLKTTNPNNTKERNYYIRIIESLLRI